MKELDALVKGFDNKIELSANKLFDVFGIENGETILSKYFKKVEFKKYDDYLLVDKSKPIIDYILSCHGNQNELIGPRINEFRYYVNGVLKKEKNLKITKDAGMFICYI